MKNKIEKKRRKQNQGVFIASQPSIQNLKLMLTVCVCQNILDRYFLQNDWKKEFCDADYDEILLKTESREDQITGELVT